MLGALSWTMLLHGAVLVALGLAGLRFAIRRFDATLRT